MGRDESGCWQERSVASIDSIKQAALEWSCLFFCAACVIVLCYGSVVCGGHETFRFDTFFKEAHDLGADYVAIGHYGGCDFRNRILSNATDASGCCGKLAQPAAVSNYMSRSFIYSSVLLLGEDSTLINNECRDNLGYGIADAMGFDLFAFVFLGGG